MEDFNQAFPIEVVCGPEATSSFTDFGFHEVERSAGGRAVRLHKPDGCEPDLDRICALGRAGVTVLAESAGDWIIDAKILAAKSGVVLEFDPDMLGRPARTQVSFTDPIVERSPVARYWQVRLEIERELGLLPKIVRGRPLKAVLRMHKPFGLKAIAGKAVRNLGIEPKPHKTKDLQVLGQCGAAEPILSRS